MRKSEEIKRLKNLKKQEIASKLSLIQKYSGSSQGTFHIVMNPESFDKDFDPEEHDQVMSSIFDENYYDQTEANPEVDDLELEKVQENDIDILRIEKTEELPLSLKEGPPGSWWRCDGCGTGIAENKWRFDCTECPNYTLCEKCRSTVVHVHRLKRLKVPLGCAPPNDVVTVLCDGCNKDITSEIRYDCSVCEDYTLCDNCVQSVQHPHRLKSVQDLWQELDALDYEDLVAGIPCKFKYRQVKPQDYGLTEEEIIEWDDKKLNKLVSLKKLAPYRDDQGLANISRKKKKFIEKSIEPYKKKQKSKREDSYKI